MRYWIGFVLFARALGTLRLMACGDEGESGAVTCSDIEPCTIWLLGDSNTVGMASSSLSPLG